MVGRPFGLTVPLRIALVVETLLAAPVTAAGAGAPEVVRTASAPRFVPVAFVATKR
jgi:hypothetical protein